MLLVKALSSCLCLPSSRQHFTLQGRVLGNRLTSYGGFSFIVPVNNPNFCQGLLSFRQNLVVLKHGYEDQQCIHRHRFTHTNTQTYSHRHMQPYTHRDKHAGSHTHAQYLWSPKEFTNFTKTQFHIQKNDQHGFSVIPGSRKMIFSVMYSPL